MGKTKVIKIECIDDSILMNQCKDIYLHYHPEMLGVPISRLKMFKEVVGFYLKWVL